MNNSELFIEVWEVDRARMARARRATQCVKKVSVQRVVDRRCTTAQIVTSRFGTQKKVLAGRSRDLFAKLGPDRRHQRDARATEFLIRCT